MSGEGRARVAAAVIALGLPLALGLVLAVWALAVSPLQSATGPQPLVGAVESAERRDAESTSVALVPAQSFPVLTQSSGTVTMLSIVPDEMVTTGATALVVDGRPVVAYVSASPLFRDIGAGMEGDDVKTAQQLLADLGYLGAVDGKAGSSTVAAIRAFNTANGLLGQSDFLAVGSLLWIPEGSMAPLSVSARVGQHVAPQTELYTTTSGADRIEVNTKGAEGDRLLKVNSVVVTLPAGQTVLTDAEDVAAIKATLGDQTKSAATLESVTPRTVGTVPTSAVVAEPGGAVCFFTDVHGPGMRIDAAAGSFGLVDVGAELIGSPVLINPRSVRENLKCDSS